MMEPEAHSATQEELESLYTCKTLGVMEKIFGPGWTSPGGCTTAREFSVKLGLRPGQKVLEIGSGLGGAAFLFAFQYGAHVQGVDYSNTMVQLANQRLSKQDAKVIDKVNFTLGNILEVELPDNTFDAVYSRDALLHIKDKETLFKKIKKWLKPGGKVFFTDFCRGESKISEAFKDFVIFLKCTMFTLKDYEEIMRKSGLDILETTDISEKLIQISKDELKCFVASKESTVEEFGQQLYDEYEDYWKLTIDALFSKELAWGCFLASG